MASCGILVVMSAPSGAGKMTLLDKVRQTESNLEHTVSATTRAPRAGEADGVDYHFLTAAAFEARVQRGEFAEWAEVHGNRYGTLVAELDRCVRSGKDVILELDVQGMHNLRRLRPDAVTVFLMPPSMEELERRLRRRGTDDDAVIDLRLRNAVDEMAQRWEFDYIIVNDDLDRAAGDMGAILRAERLRAARQQPRSH